jgi:hypothetical protein
VVWAGEGRAGKEGLSNRHEGGCLVKAE